MASILACVGLGLLACGGPVEPLEAAPSLDDEVLEVAVEQNLATAPPASGLPTPLGAPPPSLAQGTSSPRLVRTATAAGCGIRRQSRVDPRRAEVVDPATPEPMRPFLGGAR